jgi:hypothetical protein
MLAMLVPSCPWDGFAPATMEFCERPLCGLVTEPSNTWSNIGYVVVGVVVLRLVRAEGKRHLAPIGWSALAVALGSAFFHASSTFVGQVVDIGAMFLFAVFWLALDLQRLLAWRTRTVRVFHGVLTALSVLVLIMEHTWGVQLFSLQVTGTFLVEIALFMRQRRAARADTASPEPRVDYRHLVRLSLFFALAYAIWQLDFHRVVCDRDLHVISGHAVWHLLNSACFYFLYRFFCQFAEPRST